MAATRDNGNVDDKLLKDKKPSCRYRESRPYRLRPKPMSYHTQRPIFNKGEKSDFSEVTQFHARCVNGTLLSKATINVIITDIALGHLDRRYK